MGHGGSKSEIHKWHFAHVPQTIVQLNAWHQNNLELVTSHDEKKTTTNNEPGFIRGLLAWTRQRMFFSNGFQQLQPVQKFSLGVWDW